MWYERTLIVLLVAFVCALAWTGKAKSDVQLNVPARVTSAVICDKPEEAGAVLDALKVGGIEAANQVLAKLSTEPSEVAPNETKCALGGANIVILEVLSQVSLKLPEGDFTFYLVRAKDATGPREYHLLFGRRKEGEIPKPSSITEF